MSGLPENLTTITVTGFYGNGSTGAPYTGYVTFAPSAQLADATGSIVIPAIPLQVDLVDGAFSIVLVCTDNTTITTPNWTWNVVVYIDGAIPVPFSVRLPSTLGETVDISDLTPVQPQAATVGVIATAVPMNVTGVPAENDVLTATGPTTANWQPSAGGAVASVNGQTGTVVLTASSVSAIPTSAAGATSGVATLDTTGHLSATQLYKPWQFYVGSYGAKGDNETDDTPSIRAAIAAAFNYAAAHTGYAEVIFDPLVYLLTSAPITGATFNGATFEGSAQLPIPAQAQAAEHIVLAFVGTHDQTALYNWEQTVPQRAGAVLRSTYAAGATLPATGEASVLGGPTPHFVGDPPSSWSNVHVVIDGLSIEVPTNPQICGADLRCVGSANVKNFGALALSASTGAPQIPDPNWAFGLAMPVVNNNDECRIENYSCEGFVIGAEVFEHADGSMRIANCYDGLVCYSSSGFPHRNHFAYVSIENCVNLVVLNGGFNKLDIDCLDVEWGSGAIIKDASSSPALGKINITSNGSDGATLNAAMNSGATAVDIVNGSIALEITNLDQKTGPVTPPAVPASTVTLVNPFWRLADISIAGGTVTEVAIDGVNQLLTSGKFTLPSGHSITLTYSAAPSWAWTLIG